MEAFNRREALISDCNVIPSKQGSMLILVSLGTDSKHPTWRWGQTSKSKEADTNNYFCRQSILCFCTVFLPFLASKGMFGVFSSILLNPSCDSAVITLWIWDSKKLLCISTYWTWPGNLLFHGRWFTAFIHGAAWPHYCSSEGSSSVAAVLVYIFYFLSFL